MRHSIHKIQFTKGRDNTRGSLRKLIGDFVRFGKVSTTVKRAKVVKSTMDRLVSKAQHNSQGSKNMLIKAFGDARLVDTLITFSSEHFPKKTGGYVRLVRLGARQGDGAEIARVEWVEITTPVKALSESSKKTKETIEPAKPMVENAVAESTPPKKRIAKTAAKTVEKKTRKLAKKTESKPKKT